MLKGTSAVLLTLALGISGAVSAASDIREYPVPRGSHPHDVAPALDGGVWYTAQNSGELGWLDPKTGKTRHIALGRGSSPHGVIVGPDGAPWITDSGLNAIVRVDPKTDKVSVFPLPKGTPYTNLNTATFDKNGILWFRLCAGPRDARPDFPVSLAHSVTAHSLCLRIRFGTPRPPGGRGCTLRCNTAPSTMA